jgi:uncharacterized RDD family membrane protein YckC
MDGPSPVPNPYEPPRADVEQTAAQPGEVPHELASRWRRLGAALIDGTLLALAGAPRVFADGGTVQCGVHVGQPAFRPDDLSTPGVISTVLFLALMAVQSHFIASRGQSIGKRVASSRIVTMNGSRASFRNAVVLRTWVPMLLPLVPFVGGLVALVDVLFIFGPSKRCLHDLVAGTKVVEAD